MNFQDNIWTPKMCPAMQYCDVITNPGYRTAVILKIVKSPYLSQKSSDFDEILYTTSDIEPDYSYVTKNFLNSRWRPPPSSAAILKIVFWPQLIDRLSNFSEILYEEAERHVDKG